VLSVIVPTFNRARALGETLESLINQQVEPPYEIIVVDNNSTDDTRAVVEAFAQKAPNKVRYVFETQQGSSAARNAGIAAARGDILAFVDDDVVAHPDWLSELSATYATHPDAWCVGGKVTLSLPKVLPPWFDPSSNVMVCYLSYQDFGEGVVRVDYPLALSTANFSVRREVLARIGVFDTTLGRFDVGLLCGEDVDLCWRIQQAGGHVYFNSRAAVTHLIPETRVTKGFFRERAYWEGRTDALLAAQRNELAPPQTLIRLALFAAKDLVKSVGLNGTGHRPKGFEHEVAARKMLGYLQQAVLSRLSPRSPLTASRARRKSALSVAVVRTLGELVSLSGSWNELAQRTETDVFQDAEWASIWWRYFSSGRSMHTMTVWDGEDLVGIAPFFVETDRLLNAPFLRRLRLVGAGHSGYLNLIVARGHEVVVGEALADHLVSEFTQWDALDLEDAPESAASAGPFLEAMASRGCRLESSPHHACFAIHLPRTLDDYLATLTPRTRKNLLREKRRLLDAGYRFELVSQETPIDQPFEDFVALHERRWTDRGSTGAFADPAFKAFHRQIAEHLHRRGRLILRFITLNGHRIAAEYSFQNGNKVSLYFTGLDPESPAARYSPGNVLLLQSIQAAIERGMRVYDLMRGAEAYKKSLGATEEFTWHHQIIAPHRHAVLRVQIRDAVRRLARLARRACAEARAHFPGRARKGA
jgi:CelD/BcsL family acetyltransferase involved in cellulose biosynthesis/GT2 family glycosyltransferase